MVSPTEVVQLECFCIFTRKMLLGTGWRYPRALYCRLDVTNVDANPLPPATSLRPRQRGTETISSSETYTIQLPLNDIGLEGLIVVGALVAIVFFGLLFRSFREVPHQKAEGVEKYYRPKGARKRPASVASLETYRKQSGIQPARFEAKTSAHLQNTRILQGSAYVRRAAETT